MGIFFYSRIAENAGMSRLFISAPIPPKQEPEEKEDSIRRRRLYLATRSLRQGAPDFIKGAEVATAMSAIVVSSVSPERWDKMCL